MILWLTRITTNLQLPPSKYPNNKHIPWNYTWVVLSERNDVVWATSKTSTNIWWPASLTPDLCKLVQGVVAPCGLEAPGLLKALVVDSEQWKHIALQRQHMLRLQKMWSRLECYGDAGNAK